MGAAATPALPGSPRNPAQCAFLKPSLSLCDSIGPGRLWLVWLSADLRKHRRSLGPAPLALSHQGPCSSCLCTGGVIRTHFTISGAQGGPALPYTMADPGPGTPRPPSTMRPGSGPPQPASSPELQVDRVSSVNRGFILSRGGLWPGIWCWRGRQ